MLHAAMVNIPPASNPNFPRETPYYAWMDYDVDLKARQMVITQLVSPQGKTQKTSIRLKLYDAPEDDWPCGPATWQRLLENRQIDPHNVPGRRQ
jgi:hypothetical protein